MPNERFVRGRKWLPGFDRMDNFGHKVIVLIIFRQWIIRSPSGRPTTVYRMAFKASLMASASADNTR